MKYHRKIPISRADTFMALAQWAAPMSCYAFFLTELGDFSCAIGARRELYTASSGPGAHSFEKVRALAETSACPIAGYFGYDLKNELEALESQNPDVLEMPDAAFFEPELWVYVKNGRVRLESDHADLLDAAEAAISKGYADQNAFSGPMRLSPLATRQAYLDGVESLKMHLRRGDIYEANYCMQFAGKASNFDPLQKFLALQGLTEAPFSVFAKLGAHFILSASPERFLKNDAGALISQPIKGTIKRSTDPKADALLSHKLRQDPKEQSENVMIVDLVRNDLSRVAARGSVHVKALFEMVPFKTVHHMVSTIAAQLAPNYTWMDAIKACFPMGSMTGAPKISAMKCIEAGENFKRGAYSGAFGWVSPSGDFDLNVMIRTVFYNQLSETVAFGVGSAITIKASAEQEYEECLLKAQALVEALNTSSTENAHAPAIW